MQICRGTEFPRTAFDSKRSLIRVLSFNPARKGRDWHEAELQPRLLLYISEMIRSSQLQSTFSFTAQWAQLRHAIAAALPDAPNT
jgi:hypothetical protein